VSYLLPEVDDGEAPQGRLVGELRRARRRNRASLGLAGLGAASVFASSVQRVQIRTAFTPTLTWAPGARDEAQGSGFQAWLLRLLRPDVSIDTTLGSARYAPAGQSDGEWFPLLAAGVMVLAGGAMYMVVRGIAKGRVA
jgi:hypothetical protein